MPDLFDLFSRWWKQIISFVVISVVLAAIIVFLVPRQYLGETTALPAPAYSTDKTAVFSQNLQELYSALGSPDDVDRMVGTGRLDTVYNAVAEKLNLAEHYKINKEARTSTQKAALILKRRTSVIKTDYGELKVKVWDHNRDFAAAMANSIMEKLQQIHQDLETVNNSAMLSKIKEEYAARKKDYTELVDSMQHSNNSAVADLLNIQKNSLIQQILEYEKLLNQYTLMVNARPQALIIIEKASPALNPDKPKPLQIVIATAFLSLFFAVVAAIILERRKIKFDQ